MKFNSFKSFFAAFSLAFTFSAGAANNFPEVFLLPNGWAPEGIASGRGTEFYAGARHPGLNDVAIYQGAVLKGNFRTGETEILVPPDPTRVALGLKFDSRSDLLFVAGGPTGQGYVYDTTTGADVAVFQFTAAGFVNDVVLTRTAAYFTDSANAALYVVSLRSNGELADPETFEVLPLTGDFQLGAGINANGIVATPNGDSLIIVQSNTGFLFHVDPNTGETTQIDLDDGTVTRGDGLLLDGRTLYIVRNTLNVIAVIHLDPSFLSGEYVDDITSSSFAVPTTIAEFGNSLYAVNARFGTPIAGTNYEVVRVSK